MNLPQANVQPMQQTMPMGEDDDSINLLDLLDIVLDQKNSSAPSRPSSWPSVAPTR